MSAPAVFTIILNWNGLADTRECLASLRKIDYPNNRVLVVDNGSEGDEATALEEESGGFIEVIRNAANLGFAGGMNVGIRRALEAGAEYVLLLNNDVTVEPGFLAAMIAAAGRHPNLAAACPKAYFRDRPEVIYSTGGSVNLWTGTARQLGRGERDRGQFEGEATRDYADGLCMLIPAAAIEKVGLLDEEYFTYWEETDWCRGRRCGTRRSARSRRRTISTTITSGTR
jgi:GT2 family glycosyltransferase